MFLEENLIEKTERLPTSTDISIENDNFHDFPQTESFGSLLALYKNVVIYYSRSFTERPTRFL